MPVPGSPGTERRLRRRRHLFRQRFQGAGRLHKKPDDRHPRRKRPGFGKAVLLEAKTAIELQAQQDRSSAFTVPPSHDPAHSTPVTVTPGIRLENGAVRSRNRKLVYTDIHDDSLWLIRLVENLLSITRIDNGSLSLTSTPSSSTTSSGKPWPIWTAASEHTHRRAGRMTLLMAEADPRLIVQGRHQPGRTTPSPTPRRGPTSSSAPGHGRRLLITG